MTTVAEWLLPGGVLLSVSDAAGQLQLRHGTGASEALVAALRSEPVPAPFRVQRFAPMPGGHGERPITADQTNESVIVGGRLIVKWLPRPERRPHPAPPTLSHLAEVGFTVTARPYAALFVEIDDTEVLLALVVAYLPEAVDGWEWCVGDLLDSLDGRSSAADRFPADLGQITARLHAALATPSSVLPEPLGVAGAADLRRWHEAAVSTATEAIELTTRRAPEPGSADASNAGPVADASIGLADDQRWLRSHADLIKAAMSPLAEFGATMSGAAMSGAAMPGAATPTMPIHGDLHVGQVLRWRHGYAIVDFDGNPVISSPASASINREPAARDVAQMLTSLDHVGRIADRRTEGAHAIRIAVWISTAQQLFMDAYRAELSARGASELLDERLLEPFTVEQECRELLYAARFLPRWRYAPMGTLRAFFLDPSGAQ